MFGISSILNLLASSVYPIVASYNAYDNYARISTKAGYSTINVGGVSIPLGTILKKATTSEGAVEEDTLNFRLLTVQMWMIYWVVHATVSVAESLLLLKSLPFYSTVRLFFSVWLIAPIIVSSSRMRSSQWLSASDMQKEWAVFSTQGCGLLYFKYLKPFMDEHRGFLDKMNVEPLLAAASSKFVLPLAQQAGMRAFKSRRGSEPSSSYTSMLGEYARKFTAASPTSNLSNALENELSEYDVVDKPVRPSEDDVRSRVRKPTEGSVGAPVTTEGSVDAPVTSSADGSGGNQAHELKRGWFW